MIETKPIASLTSQLMATILALTVALISGCASSNERASTGELVDDSVVTTKVKTALTQERARNFTEISVETFKGTVKLSGFVTSQRDVDQAVKIAKAVPGVKSVENDMTLKGTQ